MIPSLRPTVCNTQRPMAEASEGSLTAGAPARAAGLDQTAAASQTVSPNRFALTTERRRAPAHQPRPVRVDVPALLAARADADRLRLPALAGQQHRPWPPGHGSCLHQQPEHPRARAVRRRRLLPAVARPARRAGQHLHDSRRADGRLPPLHAAFAWAGVPAHSAGFLLRPDRQPDAHLGADRRARGAGRVGHHAPLQRPSADPTGPDRAGHVRDDVLLQRGRRQRVALRPHHRRVLHLLCDLCHGRVAQPAPRRRVRWRRVHVPADDDPGWILPAGCLLRPVAGPGQGRRHERLATICASASGCGRWSSWPSAWRRSCC